MVDVGADRLTVMVAGPPDKLDGFEGLLETYEVLDLQRTGRVALRKIDVPPLSRNRLVAAGLWEAR